MFQVTEPGTGAAAILSTGLSILDQAQDDVLQTAVISDTARAVLGDGGWQSGGAETAVISNDPYPGGIDTGSAAC